MPKSVTLAEPSSSTRTFCGLTSRWTIWRGVGGAERAGDLDRVGDRLVDRQPADAADAVLERLALDVLEDDVGAAVLLARVDDADDVRVVELGDRARLAAEALELVGVRRDVAVHELDRDLALERRVEGAVDRRHPAGPDLGVEPVAAAQLHADERAHLLGPIVADVPASLGHVLHRSRLSMVMGGRAGAPPPPGRVRRRLRITYVIGRSRASIEPADAGALALARWTRRPRAGCPSTRASSCAIRRSSTHPAGLAVAAWPSRASRAVPPPAARGDLLERRRWTPPPRCSTPRARPRARPRAPARRPRLERDRRALRRRPRARPRRRDAGRACSATATRSRATGRTSGCARPRSPPAREPAGDGHPGVEDALRRFGAMARPRSPPSATCRARARRRSCGGSRSSGACGRGRARRRALGASPRGSTERPDQVRQSGRPPRPSALGSVARPARHGGLLLGRRLDWTGSPPAPGRRSNGAGSSVGSGSGGLQADGSGGGSAGGARPAGRPRLAARVSGERPSICSPASGCAASSIASSIWRSASAGASARLPRELGLGLLLALGLALAGLGERALGLVGRQVGRAGVVAHRAADVGGLGRGGGLLGRLVDRPPAAGARAPAPASRCWRRGRGRRSWTGRAARAARAAVVWPRPGAGRRPCRA